MLDFYPALSGLPASERKRRVPELLGLVGLRDWGEVRLRKYSKGMLQRLGLAQALMHRPRLLILDEPTDGVDPVGRHDIRDILDRLTATGVTVFLNSHLLSEVESFCDHVAILRKGEVALEGEISALVAGHGYKVAASAIPQAALEQIRSITSSLTPLPDAIEFAAATREQANAIIDRIRQAGGLIESLRATSNSLEDVFIRVTKDEKAA